MTTVVVKIGGNIAVDPVLDDVADRVRAGERVVVVHGGGPDVDRLAGQLGVPVRHLHSPDGTRSRRTDPAMLETLTMSLLGRVKPALVAGLRRRGVAAVGLCGADGGILTAVRKEVLRAREGDRVVLVRDDLSGKLRDVDPRLLRLLLGDGLVPVLSPPASTVDGQLLNVDADRVASAVAVALDADALLLCTDVPGVLRDPADHATVIPTIDTAAVPAVGGRMAHKVRAAVDAVHKGVSTVVIGVDADRGTRFVQGTPTAQGTSAQGTRVVQGAAS
uniref:Acetylglutamate kinase n=1 Tax=uncultured bacterium esnapd17 TaxID=1366598 RepID=S5UBS9_9BACT|nr:acetylglutamate kinase [uncultured bacterium esnapd17]